MYSKETDGATKGALMASGNTTKRRNRGNASPHTTELDSAGPVDHGRVTMRPFSIPVLYFTSFLFAQLFYPTEEIFPNRLGQPPWGGSALHQEPARLHGIMLTQLWSLPLKHYSRGSQIDQ